MVVLRDVTEADLTVFFEHQLDPAAGHMAAFAAEDPADREAFDAKWRLILDDATLPIKTIVFEGQVVGHVLCWTDAALGTPEVSYWIGQDFWGKGIATQALQLFLALVTERPLLGRAAKDNVGSLRVLEKCGFALVGAGTGFANARGQEVEELILELR